MSANPTGRNSRWAGSSVLGVVGLILVVNVVWVARNWDALRPISPGDDAPTFSLKRIDSSRASDNDWIDLVALRGDVVLVDFWAEWCRPCRKAMPAIENVYQRFRGQGFKVVSVKTDGGFGKRGRQIEAATSFPIVADDAGVARRYKVTTIPHLVLIDHRGVVRYVHRGYRGVGSLTDDLADQVKTLLARRGLR